MSGIAAQRILAKIDAAWSRLRDATERLGSLRLEENTSAGWTAKAMLAHIAFWEEAAVGWVTVGIRKQQLRDGWRFGSGYVLQDDWPRADAHNAREAEWARARTPGEVMARWDRAYEQLLTSMGPVTDEEALEHKEYFGRIGDHYPEHLPELEALLNKSANSSGVRQVI